MSKKISLRESVANLAKQVGISEDDLDKLYKTHEFEMKERLGGKEIDDATLEQMVLSRLSLALKKPLISTGGSGEKAKMIPIGRGRVSDWAEGARTKADKYIQKAGRDRAVKDGYIDEAGNYLFVQPDYKKGKEVPEHEYQADGFGLIKLESSKDYKFAEIRFKDLAAIQPLDWFTEYDIDAYVRENDDPNYAKITVSKTAVQSKSEYANFEDILEYIKKNSEFSDRILDTVDEIDLFAMNHEGERNAFAIVEGNVIDVAVTQKESTAVSIDDLNMLVSDTGGTNSATLWFNKEDQINFIEGSLGVKFIISTYKKDDGSVSISGMGYWVPEIFRRELPKTEGASADTKLDDPW